MTEDDCRFPICTEPAGIHFIQLKTNTESHGNIRHVHTKLSFRNNNNCHSVPEFYFEQLVVITWEYRYVYNVLLFIIVIQHTFGYQGGVGMLFLILGCVWMDVYKTAVQWMCMSVCRMVQVLQIISYN